MKWISFKQKSNLSYEKFDLNIDKILSDWTIEMALKEIIANAFDEHKISNIKKDIQISKVDNTWIIRDYGTGIKLNNFIQNENKTKKERNDLIGKFGIGLKDALATLYNNNIDFKIESENNIYTIAMAQKASFEEQTLHVFQSKNEEKIEGTKFIFYNLKDDYISAAKDYFLFFNQKNKKISENTYGEIYKKQENEESKIYINGMLYAKDEGLYYDYNILKIDANIKKGLNRERLNLNRSVYSDRIQQMLLKSSEALEGLQDFVYNNLLDRPDELKWINVEIAVIKLIESKHGKENVLILKPTDNDADTLSYAGDRSLIYVSNQTYDKIPDEIPEIINSTFTGFANNIVPENFEYHIIPFENLNEKEKSIFILKDKVLQYFEEFNNIKKNWNINIVESLPKTIINIVGLTIHNKKQIYISKDQLENKIKFLSTLFHELCHAISYFHDATIEFEKILSEWLGILANLIF